MDKMKIYLGSDHRGFRLKEKIKTWLVDWGYAVKDFGAFKYNNKDDYPDFIKLVAQKVGEDPRNKLGIVLGHSGQGEAITANKYVGIRAAVFYGGPQEIIELSKQHNNANILSFGASYINDDEAKEALKLWLETKFSFGLRHLRRINKIKMIEGLACDAQIIPAVLAKTTEELNQKLSRLKDIANCVQIDIMDSKFVPNSSITLKDLARLEYDFDYEAHLMVYNPEKYFPDCETAGVKRVVFHVEATKNPSSVIKNMANYSFEKAIALNPDTKVSAVLPYVPEVDAILILSVRPGFSAQAFISATLEKVREIKKIAPHIKVGFDGGIKESNIKLVSKAGADYLIVGSGLFESKNIEQEIAKMQRIANES